MLNRKEEEQLYKFSETVCKDSLHPVETLRELKKLLEEGEYPEFQTLFQSAFKYTLSHWDYFQFQHE